MEFCRTEREDIMNKIKCLVVTMVLILGLTACASKPMAAVYDDNSKIASNSNTFSLINDMQEIEGKSYKGNIGKFEGMDTIWTCDATEDENVELAYLISVSAGKMKLVLIAPDNSLTTIAEITPETKLDDFQTYMLPLKKGENRIKVVAGEDTQIDMELSIPVGEFSELGMD